MPLVAGPSLAGRTFLVTGATAGVGAGAVRALVARGAFVIGASRGGGAGEASTGLALDLVDPASIRAAAAVLRATHARLDGLVNAAGAIVWRPAPTPFGVDRAWAVNYLGHALLTAEVWPLLEAAPRARVVTVAGSPGLVRRLRVHPAALATTPTSPLRAAGAALAARVTWTASLARRRPGRVVALAFHPGLVRSRLGDDAPPGGRLLAGLANLVASPECRIAATLVADPGFDDAAGGFFDPRGRRHRFPHLEDAMLGERLWAETESRLQV